MLRALVHKVHGGSLKKQQMLNIMLANLASGLNCKDIDAGECQIRLARVVEKFDAHHYRTPDRLYQLLLDEMQSDASGWYARQPNLGAYLNDLMLCVADHWGLAAWMGVPGSGVFKDADQAIKACESLNEILDLAQIDEDFADPRLDASIGKPRDGSMPARPLWLTPFQGEVASLVEEAADEPSAKSANRLCALLGLSHIGLGSPVIAIILDATARTLSEDGMPRIAGPTSLEAGGFQHYRHYPNPRRDRVDGFGRTYELNADKRSGGGEEHPFGAPEAVRPPMLLRDALEFVYIGHTALEPVYDRKIDTGFMAAIGADAPFPQLMETIGKAVDMWSADDS